MAKEKEKNTQPNPELGPSEEEIMDIWSKLEGEPSESESEEVEEETQREEGEPTEGGGEEKKEQRLPDIMDLLPEKFRTGDPQEALRKFVRSYQDLEAKLTRTSQELSEATRLLKTLATASTSTRPEPKLSEGEKEEEIDLNIEVTPDELLQNPSEALKKAISQAVKQLAPRLDPANAAQAVMAQMALAQLRAKDPKTFELVKADLLQVLKEKPYLDTIEGLEIAYEEAKQRYRQRQEELKKQLIDEDLVKSLKESVLRELASKVGAQAREVTGISSGAGGGSSEVEKAKPREKTPGDVLKDLIKTAGVSSPLLTEDF